MVASRDRSSSSRVFRRPRSTTTRGAGTSTGSWSSSESAVDGCVGADRFVDGTGGVVVVVAETSDVNLSGAGGALRAAEVDPRRCSSSRDGSVTARKGRTGSRAGGGIERFSAKLGRTEEEDEVEDETSSPDRESGEVSSGDTVGTSPALSLP